MRGYRGASIVPEEALIVDNTDDGITYSGGWELIQSSNGIISNANSGFYRNTVHRTTVPGAVVTFTFTGTAVWYFSDIDWTHGLVQISVDGEPAEQVSGFHRPILSQRLIWYKTGLSTNKHVVTITHSGTPTQYATVDFFRYLPSSTQLYFKQRNIPHSV
ncbi:hypothetical protein FRC10_004826 [Ceratobasidium sp. 414]|nr:hypothetical protein FRC10_004826 [Ceratobasidium sp. 414]